MWDCGRPILDEGALWVSLDLAEGGEDLGPVVAVAVLAEFEADADVCEAGLEDIGAVSGAVHPGAHDAGGVALSGSDIFASAVGGQACRTHTRREVIV